MTFQSPHMEEILPKKSRVIFWWPQIPGFFGYEMLVLKCSDPTAVSLAEEYMRKQTAGQRKLPHGFVLCDSEIVQHYGTSPRSTLLELLALYHKLAVVFEGDQRILFLWMGLHAETISDYPLCAIW